MKFQPKRKLRIVVLCHEDLVPPESIEGLTEADMKPWKMEYDVIVTLRNMGHSVVPIGLYSDLGVIRKTLEEVKPHVVFNLLEEFHGLALYDQHVVSFLELMKQPYTGCNPRGLTLAHDKALSKKILAFHRIPVPAFGVFSGKRKVCRPKRLRFPLLVKSLFEEGSVGIAYASVVHDDERLAERVDLIRRQTQGPAIAEQYIEGREIYASVIGDDRLRTFAPWELVIERLPEGAPNIATSKLKWDYKYQEKVGVKTRAAELPDDLIKKLDRLSKRIYRALYLSGYARLDFRLTSGGEFFVLEANPNPNISYGEDFPEAAEHSGVPYDELLHRMISNGLSYRKAI